MFIRSFKTIKERLPATFEVTNCKRLWSGGQYQYFCRTSEGIFLLATSITGVIGSWIGLLLLYSTTLERLSRNLVIIKIRPRLIKNTTTITGKKPSKDWIWVFGGRLINMSILRLRREKAFVLINSK